jgi:hypothetical protein
VLTENDRQGDQDGHANSLAYGPESAAPDLAPAVKQIAEVADILTGVFVVQSDARRARVSLRAPPPR